MRKAQHADPCGIGFVLALRSLLAKRSLYLAPDQAYKGIVLACSSLAIWIV